MIDPGALRDCERAPASRVRRHSRFAQAVVLSDGACRDCSVKPGGSVVSVLRQYVPAAIVIQVVLEAMLLSTTVLLAIRLSPNYDGSLGAGAVALATGFAVLVISMNAAFGLYNTGNGNGLIKAVALNALALAIGVGAVYAASYLLPQGRRLQDALAVAVVMALLGLVALRQVTGIVLRGRAPDHRVLIVGTSAEALMVAQGLAESHAREIDVVGFYPVSERTDTFLPAGRIFAHEPIDAVAARLAVKEIVIAVRDQRGGVLPLRQLLDCRARGVRVTNLCGFFERLRGEVPIESLKASWLIYGDGFRQGRIRARVKRVTDIAASVVLLILAAPVMAITALAIVIESGGPVLYRQERVGCRGRLFTVIKFRSMRHDAEKHGARWATSNDERITRVGRLIRRTRIDELPQLFNVLIGDMSLVGPRPERPKFVEALTAEIPFYALRHSVKPGLTGWAQVRFHYGASVEDARRKLQYDLYYVKNNSIALDLWILLETVRVVLSGEGAH
jgi:sugar transferase (PEP-CTERM system associated)